MYIVFKNNRPAGNKKYSTYEQARQAVRKFLRDVTTFRNKGQPSLPFFALGYEIRKVD